VVVTHKGRVLGFNKPALGLFSGGEIGSAASRLLSHPRPRRAGLVGSRRLSGGRKMHVQLGQRNLSGHLSRAALPAKSGDLCHRLSAVAKAGAAAKPYPGNFSQGQSGQPL